MRKWHTAGTGLTTTMTPAEHKEKSKEWTDSKTEGFFFPLNLNTQYVKLTKKLVVSFVAQSDTAGRGKEDRFI